jgi:hypothetical protein
MKMAVSNTTVDNFDKAFIKLLETITTPDSHEIELYTARGSQEPIFAPSYEYLKFILAYVKEVLV